MPRGRNWVTGEQLAQVDNRDPFAVPVWRSPVYRTPEPVIMVVQLVRLIWRVLWFALTHPAVDAVAALVVVTWLGLGWPGVVGLAVIAVIGLAGLRVLQPVVVRPVRGGAGAGLAAVVVLPAPVEGRDDAGRARAGLPRPADAPGPGPGAPGRSGGPGAGRAGDRAGPRRLRGPGGEPGARVRRPAVPHPRRRARRGDAGAGPRRHPRRPDRRPADHRGGGPGRAAGRPVRGRLAVAAAARLDACADRRGHRVGEGLGDLVADPGAAARDRLGVGAGVGARSQADGAVVRPGAVPPVRLPRDRDGRAAGGRGRRDARPGRAVRRPDPHLHPLDRSSRSWWCWWTSWRS